MCSKESFPATVRLGHPGALWTLLLGSFPKGNLMATCSHMVRPATTARVRARALGARDVGGGEGWGGGGGEEGQ